MCTTVHLLVVGIVLSHKVDLNFLGGNDKNMQKEFINCLFFMGLNFLVRALFTPKLELSRDRAPLEMSRTKK